MDNGKEDRERRGPETGVLLLVLQGLLCVILLPWALLDRGARGRGLIS